MSSRGFRLLVPEPSSATRCRRPRSSRAACPFRSSMSLASKGAGPQRVPVTSAKVPRPPPLRPARASRRRFATSLAEMASAGDGFRHHEAAGRKATPLTTVSFERKSPGCSRVARSGAILPESEAELREVAASVAAPTLANMVETGRTPHLSAERLGGRDHPATAFRAATHAVRAVLTRLPRDGRLEDLRSWRRSRSIMRFCALLTMPASSSG